MAGGTGKIGILKIGMAVGLGGLQKGMKQANAIIGRGVMGFGALGLAANGLRMATDWMSKPFKLVNNLETATASFEVLTGSAETAAKLVADTQSMAATTSVGGAGHIQAAAKTMLGFGVASESVLPILNNLSKVAAGSSERFDSLSLVMAQTSAATKLNSQDANQFISAGIPIWKLLSEEIGVSVKEIRKMSEAGNISFDQVNAAITRATNGAGQYAQMNEKISSTMGGVWMQLSAKISLAFTKISQSIFKALNITGLLKWASSMVDVIVPYIERFVAMAATAFEKMKSMSQPVIDWLYQRWVFATGVIGKVWSNLYAIGSMIFGAIASVITAVFPIIVGLQNLIFASWVFISDVLLGAFGIIATVFSSIGAWIGQNIISWATLSGFIIDAMNVTEFCLLNWKDVVAYVGVSVLAGLITMVNDWIWLGENVFIQVVGMGKMVGEYLVGFAKWTGNVMGNLFTNIVAIFKNLGPLIRGEMNLSDLWNPLTEGFQMEISKLPDITKREMGTLEKSMSEEASALAAKLGTGYDKFLADKEKTKSLKMPEIKTDLKLNTDSAQSAINGMTPPEVNAEATTKLAAKAQIGTLEGRNALLQNAMGNFGGNKDKEAKETAKNTETTAIQMVKAVGYLGTIAGGTKSSAATLSIP